MFKQAQALICFFYNTKYKENDQKSLERKRSCDNF